MRLAARELVGERDFAAFCRRPPDGSSTVRRLERLAVVRSGHRVEVAARADGFLHQMVRSLVGMLVAVGGGARGPGELADVLASGDRARAAPIAPASGLTLERVTYGNTRR
jgi:tRNA pseudouridine38-40 synthase